MPTTVDTSASGKFTPRLLDQIATVMMTEYEGRYYKAYLRASSLRGSRRPFEPADEMRNAFDHFSLAIRGAFGVDNRKPPANPRNRNVPKEKEAIKDPKERAFVDVNQGRRHLAIGRYYCVAHEVAGYIERIDRELRVMRRNGQKIPARFRQRGAKLDRRLRPFGQLTIENIYSTREIDAWLRTFEKRISKLSRIAKDLGNLLHDITPSRKSA